jgi:hypothetical protein
MIAQVINIYLVLIRLFKHLFHIFFQQQQSGPVISNTPKTHTAIANDYASIYNLKFSRSFENLAIQDYDKNIDPAFYDNKSFKEALQEENNDIEKLWRTRILFENTPRGNVIMYYDAYKIGFAYYCDQYVPYDILNAVAMKYVLTYQCRDFFVDEMARPENAPSKILKLIEEPKKEEEKKTEGENNSSKISVKNGPFAKLKSYNMVSSKVETNKTEKEPTTSTEEKKDEKKEKHRNRFVNLGKIVNFSFIQKPKKVHKPFKTELGNGLFDNATVQKEVFSYRDFKARKLALATPDPSSTL